MELFDSSVMMAIAGVVITVGSAVLTVQRILKNIDKSRTERDAKILHTAKEEISSLRIKIKAEMDVIRAELKNLEENVEKDLGHITQTYNIEIRNMAEKIEVLRNELRQNHASTLQLLSKLVEQK